MITETVEQTVRELAASDRLPAHIVDLTALGGHLRQIHSALPDPVELYYAAKANPAGPVLIEMARHTAGFEVASGGELAHVQQHAPGSRLAFGGPGKTEHELTAIVHTASTGQPIVVHVESVHELTTLAVLTTQHRTHVDVMLRVNPPLTTDQASRPALVMGGSASPFGLDEGQAHQCLPILARASHLTLRGIHTHLASGLDAAAHLAQAAQVLAWTQSWEQEQSTGTPVEVVTLGGGMAVNYADETDQFDWAAFGHGLAQLHRSYPQYRLRLEPGRALAAYAGWYAARVTDVRPSYGQWFAILDGGTHHLRTPAARGHHQPFDVIAIDAWPGRAPRPQLTNGRVTLAGALCTPKDVLAADQPVTSLRAGDVVAFGMAGAYGWNISHLDFLMHPRPTFHYV